MIAFKMSHKKQIFKVNTLKKLLDNEHSCVSLVQTTRLLALPPFFLNDMKSGILYLLNNMLKKYDRSLGGIVIGYQNIKVLMDENTGIIPMGTSETEVNISVEFYIFQPKIGSFLEGVVNKKSNSHIGCLVHRYFNATILKPEDVDYDKWICRDLNVDDKIIFKVKDLDFTCLLPLIEGVIEDERFLRKYKSNSSISFDLCSDIKNNFSRKYPDEVFFSENTRKNKNDNECVMKDNVSENFAELSSFINSKKKKKEEKEIIITEGSKTESHNNEEKNEGLDVKEFTSYTLCKEFNINEKQCSKKKKKKDRRKQENGKSSQESSNLMEIFPRRDTSNSCKTLEKLESMDCDDLNYFVKSDKIELQKKKEKKSKIEKTYTELNKTNQCLFSNEAEDEIFYSTQLDPSLPKKMKISCCSPVLKNTSFEEKFQKQDLKSQDELNEKEKKQKHQKQKRKLGSIEDHAGSKKIKASYSCFSENETSKDKINFDEGKSIVQTLMEKVSKKQVSLGIKKTDKERSKEWKKKREMLNFTENKESKAQENFEMDSLLEEMRKQEIERVKEELNISIAESTKEIKKGKMKVKKKEVDSFKERTSENSFGLKKCTTPLNGAHYDGEKFTVQNVRDDFLKEKTNRVKDKCDKSDTKRLKKEKKAKKALHTLNNVKETSESKVDNTLYEKLLKEAKSAVDFDEDKSSNLANAKELGKKSEVKNSMEKTDQNFHKTKNCLETPDKYKNGSMYDAAFTPEKLNFEKSLFSDSEQSNTSPTKRDKKMANSVAEITTKAVAKAVKNRSVKEKERRRSSNAEQERESLFEKLLSEAKSLIQSSSECSLAKKKEKHLQTPKNKKNDCKTS